MGDNSTCETTQEWSLGTFLQLHRIATNNNEGKGPKDGLSERAEPLGVVELNGNADELGYLTSAPQRHQRHNETR